jgi:hypothetical protein
VRRLILRPFERRKVQSLLIAADIFAIANIEVEAGHGRLPIGRIFLRRSGIGIDPYLGSLASVCFCESIAPVFTLAPDPFFVLRLPSPQIAVPPRLQSIAVALPVRNPALDGGQPIAATESMLVSHSVAEPA